MSIPQVARRTRRAAGSYRCPETGVWTSPHTHLEVEPPNAQAELLWCRTCRGCGTVTVGLPDLPDDVDDGYGWMNALRGWEVVPLWGRDGYDLGRWPLQVLAISRAPRQ